MTSKSLRAYSYIYVDGVKFAITWKDVRAGTSFFIPCINAHPVIRQVNKYFRQAGWKLIYEVREENDYFGVRIWRIL